MLRIVPWLPPVFEDRAEAGRVLAASVAEVPRHWRAREARRA